MAISLVENQHLASALDKFVKARTTSILNQGRFIAQAERFIAETGLPFQLCLDPEHGSNVYDLIFDWIARFHPTELVYRDYFIQQMLSEKSDCDDDIAFGELPLAGVRADFIRVNGKSRVYEFKTEYDSLSRFAKQQESYSEIADLVTMVVHERHLKKLEYCIPEFVGLIVVTHHAGKFPKFELLRHATEHGLVSNSAQAKVLSVAELQQILRNYGYRGVKDRHSLELAFCGLGGEIGNDEFKLALRRRKRKTWCNFYFRHELLPKLVTDYFFRYYLSDFFFEVFQSSVSQESMSSFSSSFQRSSSCSSYPGRSNGSASSMVTPGVVGTATGVKFSIINCK